MIDELGQHGLFEKVGEKITAPVPYPWKALRSHGAIYKIVRLLSTAFR
jgi:hypothetical protein